MNWGGEILFMKSLSIHLTDTCNNSCIFCVVGSHRGTPEKVNRKMVYEFLKENMNEGYDSVNIHGGEPTIVPEFLEIIKMIKKLGFPAISLQTNGRFFSDIEFAKRAIEYGVNLLVVSLHGHTAELHDYFSRTNNSFKEAISGIKNAVNLGCKVRTNTCVCKQNYKDLTNIVNYSMDLGVSHINISNLHTAGNCLKNFDLVVPKLEDVIPHVKAAVDRCINRGVKITLEGYANCILDDYDKYLIDWEENKFTMLYKSFILKDYSKFMETQTKLFGQECKLCSDRKNCGGIYKEYAAAYGFSETKPRIKETSQ